MTRRARAPVVLGWFAGFLAAAPVIAAADEGGASFWVPGQYGSFAAWPGDPGWSLPIVYYHSDAAGGAGKSFTRGGQLVAGVANRYDLVYLTPTYTFTRPVWGAQAAVSVSWAFGGASTSVSATLSGPGGAEAAGGRTEDIRGGCDVSPQFSLKWSKETHSGMAYVMANVPVGSYEADRLANLGLNHWAWDLGGAYTHSDNATGRELSATLGVTYNAANPATDYKSGLDGHLDWALSQFVSKGWRFGAVGYVYRQLSGDSGSGATLGDFESSAIGLGPQLGGDLSVGGQRWSSELKAYWDLETEHRPAGWSLWASTSISFGRAGDP